MNTFKVIKTRGEYNCAECNCKMPKGSYVFGSGWIRLCLGCGEKFTLQGIKIFKEAIENIKYNRNEYWENKEKWEANNTLAKL